MVKRYTIPVDIVFVVLISFWDIESTLVADVEIELLVPYANTCVQTHIPVIDQIFVSVIDVIGTLFIYICIAIDSVLIVTFWRFGKVVGGKSTYVYIELNIVVYGTRGFDVNE